MAKKSEDKINQQIKVIRWLQWQVTRRNSGYRDDVAHLIATSKDKAKDITDKDDDFIREHWDQFVNREQYEKIVEVYNLTSYLYKDFIDKGTQKLCNGEGYKYCNGCIDNGNIEYRIKDEILECLNDMPLIDGKRQSLKEIKDFEKKWHIKFPIDPAIETCPPRDLFRNYKANPIIDHTFAEEEKTLSLRVSLECNKEIMMGWIRGHIEGYRCKVSKSKTSCGDPVEVHSKGSELSITIILSEPKKKNIEASLKNKIDKQLKQVQTREVYERYFRVFDLRENEQMTYREIAKKIYPNEYPEEAPGEEEKIEQTISIALSNLKQHGSIKKLRKKGMRVDEIFRILFPGYIKTDNSYEYLLEVDNIKSGDFESEKTRIENLKKEKTIIRNVAGDIPFNNDQEMNAGSMKKTYPPLIKRVFDHYKQANTLIYGD